MRRYERSVRSALAVVSKPDALTRVCSVALRVAASESFTIWSSCRVPKGAVAAATPSAKAVGFFRTRVGLTT